MHVRSCSFNYDVAEIMFLNILLQYQFDVPFKVKAGHIGELDSI